MLKTGSSPLSMLGSSSCWKALSHISRSFLLYYLPRIPFAQWALPEMLSGETKQGRSRVPMEWALPPAEQQRFDTVTPGLLPLPVIPSGRVFTHVCLYPWMFHFQEPWWQNIAFPKPYFPLPCHLMWSPFFLNYSNFLKAKCSAVRGTALMLWSGLHTIRSSHLSARILPWAGCKAGPGSTRHWVSGPHCLANHGALR